MGDRRTHISSSLPKEARSMPPKKRPYVPKTKGCHQCSRRRIHCDRTEPTCQKCASRGLRCSGLGLRLRFMPGGCFEQHVEGSVIDTERSLDQEGSRTFIGSFVEKEDAALFRVNPHNPHPTMPKGSSHAYGESAQWPTGPYPEASQGHTEEQVIALEAQICAPWDIMQPTDTPLWGRLMSGYFSSYIASEMVAIDGIHNGWRSLVLPLAQTDTLIMRAVFSVCASHISLHRDSETRSYTRNLASFMTQYGFSLPLSDPNAIFYQVISGLQQQKNLTLCSVEQKQSALVTILILLVGVMVNGRSDFAIILRMLESAIDAIGGEDKLGHGTVAEFIVHQGRKFRAYGTPFLSEEQGIQLISSPHHASQLLDCLNHRLPQLPEHDLTLMFVRDLVQQALNIYLEQVQQSCSRAADQTALGQSSMIRVQHFKETLQAFLAEHPGEQVLIWATFVAASGCVLPEHMEFFEGVFLRHYARNGFANILAGLEYLRRIWARTPTQRWTSLLANAEILVM